MGYELSKPNLRAELESDLKRLAPRNRILDFKMLTGFHRLTDLWNFKFKASYFGKALVSLLVLITINNILNWLSQTGLSYLKPNSLILIGLLVYRMKNLKKCINLWSEKLHIFPLKILCKIFWIWAIITLFTRNCNTCMTKIVCHVVVSYFLRKIVVGFHYQKFIIRWHQSWWKYYQWVYKSSTQ